MDKRDSLIVRTNNYGVSELDLFKRVAPEENIVFSYLMTVRNEKSRQVIESRFRRLARLLGAMDYMYINWAALNFMKVEELILKMIKSGMPATTTNACLSAIKSMARHGWKNELLSMEQHLKINDIKSVKATRLAKQRYIRPEEEKVINDSFDKSGQIRDKRNKAMIALMIGSGLRRAELVSLDVKQFDDLFMRTGEFTVIGKGNKERVCVVPDWAFPSIKPWLDIRGLEPTYKEVYIYEEVKNELKKVKKQMSDGAALFFRIDRHKNMIMTRLTAHAVWRITKETVNKLGLKPFAPHSFRGTCATNMLKGGIDILEVQKALGHENVTTTQRYDLSGTEGLIKNWKSAKKITQ